MYFNPFESSSLCDPLLDTKKPPFPLLGDPHVFICAQLPSIRPEETFVISPCKNKSQSGPMFVDFFIHERRFIQSISFLITGLFPKIDSTQYKRISQSVGPLLEQILLEHTQILQTLQKIIIQNPETIVQEFIPYFVKQKDLISHHRQYQRLILAMENLNIALSAELSDEFIIVTEGKPLIQLFHMPIVWQHYASQFLRYILHVLNDSLNKIEKDLYKKVKSFSRHLIHHYSNSDPIKKLQKVKEMFMKEPIPIVTSGHRILKVGTAFKQCRKVKSLRTIFLFTDYFIYGKFKGGYIVSPVVYDLHQLRVASPDWINPAAPIFALYFYAPKKSFLLQFSSGTICKKWERRITEAILSAKESDPLQCAKYEEAPIWEPDYAWKNCQFCGELYTIFIRRHHCRKCGKVGCGNCINKKVMYANFGNKLQLVCDKCIKEVDQSKNMAIESDFTDEEDFRDEEEDFGNPEKDDQLKIEKEMEINQKKADEINKSYEEEDLC